MRKPRAGTLKYFSVHRLVDQYMEGLHIKQHANKYTKECSGGTNRKLSYAMAMLGNPKIVLLDEPSTGMDPMSKRFVWDTVLASFKEDRGAILTTHSMEEADALCNRVGIMVKGELREGIASSFDKFEAVFTSVDSKAHSN